MRRARFPAGDVTAAAAPALEAVLAGAWLMVVGPCAFAAASSAPNAAPMAHLGLATQPVPLPGAGQIILVFICVAALAVGMAAILRRFGPGLGLLPRLQPPSGVVVTVLARQRLEPGVSLHIVNVGGERLAIVTGRSGVAMHTLSVGDNGASDAAPPGDRRE
jgi:hypothetical protein